MFKRGVLILIAVLLTIPAVAQDDAQPEAAIEAAQAAAEAVLGERTINYTYEILGRTTDSSLDCPLVSSEELPFEVTPVRVTLIYPDDGSYVVHASISGQFTVLCDARFGEAPQPDPADACTATPVVTSSTYVAPSLLMDGVFAAAAGESYPVYGISSEAGWLQLGSDAGLGWVDATAVNLAGNCDNLPVLAVVDVLAERTCFVTPLGGFSNVRVQPTTDAARIGRVYENAQYQVTARNTAGDWYFISPAGWVAGSVTRTIGACDGLPADDTLRGTGFVAPDAFNADTATILATLACPPQFTDYLPPRITTGEATAQVQSGGIPNALRSYPSVDDVQAPRIGAIQPGRTIDRVLAGPACNQGFVWWLVTVDGTQGWTAESSQPSDEYFLAPVGETAQPATPAQDGLFATFEGAVRAIQITSDGTVIVQTDTQGFGDARGGLLALLDENGTEITRLEDASGIQALATAADRLAYASGNERVMLMPVTASQPSIVLNTSVGGATALAFNSDGSQLAFAACADDPCTRSIVSVHDSTSGSLILTAEIAAAPVIELAFTPDDSQLVALGNSGLFMLPVIGDAQVMSWSNTDGFALNDFYINEAGTQLYVAGCNDANDPCSAGRVALIDATSARVIGVVETHDSAAIAIAPNPDGTRFTTAAAAQPQLIERSATTGQATRSATLPDGQITAFVYLDADRLLVATDDGRIRIIPLQ